jgi:signal transduction histidine kinase
MIEHASVDSRVEGHPAPVLYGVESYIAVPLLRRDGSYFGTLCTLDPAVVGVDEDVLSTFELLARLLAFELEADEQQARRESHIRTLEDIVAIAGHDIRQPLTAILGGLQFLSRRARRGASPDELADQADQLTAQVRRAVRLSDTLLDMARAETGDMAIIRSDLDLVAMVQETVDEMGMADTGHEFVVDGPPVLPFQGDERLLGRMLRNLLENVMKYVPSESGPVVVTLSEEPGDGSARVVLLSVRDAGPGVPPDQLAHLFDRSYRAPGTGSVPGTGLGLYIVRQIVEAHDGRVWAETAPGGGLEIRMVLPRST